MLKKLGFEHLYITRVLANGNFTFNNRFFLIQKSVFYFFVVALKLFGKFILEVDKGSSLTQVSEYAEKIFIRK